MGMRVSSAAEPSIATVERLMDLQEAVAERHGVEHMRWVHPTNVHITLKMFEVRDEGMLGFVREALSTLVQPLFAFQSDCVGLGCHPSPERPRVVYAGLDGSSAEVMGLLNKRLDQALKEIGVSPDPRPFKPMIVLGRGKSAEGLDLSETVDRHQRVLFGSSTIKDIILFQHSVRQGEPHHEVLDRFILGMTPES